MTDIVERLLNFSPLWVGETNGPPESNLFIDAATEITTLRAENEKLKARLEVIPGWSEGADGISCRDATIKLQDGRIARLLAENERLRVALEWYADTFCELPHNEGCGKFGDDVCAGCLARAALTEGGSHAD